MTTVLKIGQSLSLPSAAAVVANTKSAVTAKTAVLEQGIFETASLMLVDIRSFTKLACNLGLYDADIAISG